MSQKNLMSREAIDKLQELAKGIDIAMMQTNLDEKPTHIIPMSTKDVDDAGNIYFLSNRNSEHNEHIGKEGKVQLIYAKPGDYEFLTVYGNARITDNKEVIYKYYQKSDDAWFEGKDDPNITAIIVDPSDCHYWDSKNSKFISLLKIGYSAVTGKKIELGEQGDLHV